MVTRIYSRLKAIFRKTIFSSFLVYLYTSYYISYFVYFFYNCFKKEKGYHKKLREEELTKSALDNISGIGTVKKVELLKKFGSVQKIKEAQVEEIAKVKGIGLELARKIKEEL